MTESSWVQRCLFPVVLLFLVGSTSAIAQQTNGNHVEGGGALYPNFESELTLGGLFRLRQMANDAWFGFGGVLALRGDTELLAMHGGAGYLHPLDAATDLWGGPSLEYQDLTVEDCAFNAQQQENVCSSASEDDVSIGLRGGIRHRFHRQLEGEVGARLVTGDLDHVGLSAAGRYLWQNNMSVLAEIDFYDNNFGVLGGLSFAF